MGLFVIVKSMCVLKREEMGTCGEDGLKEESSGGNWILAVLFYRFG